MTGANDRGARPVLPDWARAYHAAREIWGTRDGDKQANVRLT
jgi:hypothetical protein